MWPNKFSTKSKEDTEKVHPQYQLTEQSMFSINTSVYHHDGREKGVESWHKVGWSNRKARTGKQMRSESTTMMTKMV